MGVRVTGRVGRHTRISVGVGTLLLGALCGVGILTAPFTTATTQPAAGRGWLVFAAVVGAAVLVALAALVFARRRDRRRR